MRRIKTAAMILGVASCALAGRAGVSLPFSDGFDSGTLSVNWAATGDAVTTNAPTPKDGSAYSLYSPENVKLAIATGNSNVWFNCYAVMKPMTDEDDPAIDGAAAGFYLETNGTLRAYSNSQFIAVATGVTTSGWHGFSVQLDFIARTWNLYRTLPGHTHGTAMQLVNTSAPLKFNSAFVGPQLTEIEIDGATYLDVVSVTRGDKAVPEGVAPPAYVATASSGGSALMLPGDLSGLDLRYFGAGSKLSGAFGDALGSILTSGDCVVFYDSVTPKFVIATFEGAGWDNDFTLTPTTGMFIDKAGTGTRSSTAVYTASYNQLYTHTTAGTTPIRAGWNLLALPHTAGPRQIVNGDASALKLPTPAPGDQIFLRSGSSWIILRYHGTSAKWVQIGTLPVTVTFPAGSGFWYRSRGTGSTWNSNTL